jgi:hypothetical protein
MKVHYSGVNSGYDQILHCDSENVQKQCKETETLYSHNREVWDGIQSL